MLLVIVGCIALAPTGAAAEAMPMNERISANRAESVACVRHYEGRIRAGEELRITSDLPQRDRVAILTATANLLMNVGDRDASGGLDRAEWLESDWRHELLFDTNRDLRVSREEYLTGRSSRGRASDAGLVNFQSQMSSRDVERFERLTGRAEFLQKSDLARESAMTFRAHDLDNDGQVTPADMARVSRGEPNR